MGVEVHQTCVFVCKQISYMFQSSIYADPLKIIQQKAQLKLASTVCGVKGQYSNVRQD